MLRLTLIIVALLAIILCVAILGLILGAFLPPTSSLFAVLGSMVWAPFGPFLLVAVLAAGLIGLLARARGPRRLGALLVVLSTLGIAGAGYVLLRIGWAATSAGAHLDLMSAFTPGRMDEPAPDVVETVRSIEGVDLRAAIYLPSDASVPAPVIFYIHGGGFMTGTFTETAADLRWFADRGWLVVSVEYRLFEPSRPTWDKAPEDVACALVWTSRNAERFGGDPARIALLGDSAGGNLAINLGFAASAGRATWDCGAELPMPVAIATQYPAVDPRSIYEDGFAMPGFEPRLLMEGYIGGPPDRYPDRVAAVSSATFLTPDVPPTLVILPDNDSLVPADGTVAFAREADAIGANLELVRIPFANHVYNQMAANSLGNQIGRTVRLRFLERHVR